MVDFKSYVKAMLAESDKCKDSECDDETEDSDNEDDEEDSCKTGTTGSEASCKTKKCSAEADDDETEDSDEEDEEDDEEASCRTKKCACKTEMGLKESMLYSSEYISDEPQNVMTEEVRVLCEGIKNNSVSKYLTKLSQKAEKEYAKYERKGDTQKAKTAKEASKEFKEASNKIYRCETRYQQGDPAAKVEYKQLCKQYSAGLKSIGKTARGVKGVLLTVLAGVVLLGTIGVTANANEDVISKLQSGFVDKTKMPDILMDLAKNDKAYVKKMVPIIADNVGKTAGKVGNGIRDVARGVSGKVGGAFDDLGDKIESSKEARDDAKRAALKAAHDAELLAPGEKARETVGKVKDFADDTTAKVKGVVKGTLKGLSSGTKKSWDK